MTRPLLLAMNNPISDDPRYALYPAPVNCAGWRLWRMYHEARARVDGSEPPEIVTKKEYLDGFERRNVLHARDWSGSEARRAGALLRPTLRGRTVLVLGVQTLRALALPRPTDWFVPAESIVGGGDLLDAAAGEPVRYALAPHPSGRCLEYNDESTRRRAGDYMLRMLRDAEQTS